MLTSLIFTSKRHLVTLALVVTQGLMGASSAWAAAESTPIPNFSETPQGLQWLESVTTQGVAREQALTLLKQAQFQSSVIQAIAPPKTPAVKNWDTYRARFVESYRIKKGYEFWKNNADSLAEAEKQFGVPQEVIVAIIGVETIYGRHTGNFRVIDALATLGFAWPSSQRDRSKFFRNELLAFIKLCNQSGLDPLEVKGSYAGAVGLGQFMPSSWLQFAKDGDGDGKVDLFHSPTDAIFSVANFLKVHGWTPGKTDLVGVEIKPHADLNTLLEPDILPSFTSQQMQNWGAMPEGSVLPDEKLALVKLVRGEEEPTYVVGGQNFYTVTRYNRSAFYATAVLELAQAVKLHKKLQTWHGF